MLKKRGYNTAVGDEGGFAPILKVERGSHRSCSRPSRRPATSPASRSASPWIRPPANSTKDGKYVFKKSDKIGQDLRGNGEVLGQLGAQYPIVSLEDGMAENDWEGWQNLTEELGGKIQLVGDDIFVTNTQLLPEGIDQGIANSILIKVNQIGTVTETLEAIDLAAATATPRWFRTAPAKPKTPFIADFAVATGAGQIKTGSASRTDRIAKYNQLLRIEEELGKTARFLGLKALNYKG